MKTRIRTFSPITIKMVLALLLAAAVLGMLLVLVAQAAPGDRIYYADTFLPARDMPGNLADPGLVPAAPAAPANGSAFTAVVTDPLTAVSDSSVAWGDYDNDGDLDILLVGDNGSGSYIARVYRNEGSDTFTTAVTTDTLTGVAEGSSVAWGDYDNDGDLDILLTGIDTEGEPIAAVYRNDGSNTFTEAVTDTLMTVNDSSVAWGDYDNDGDLDILLTGNGSSGEVAMVYRNDGSDGPSGGWAFTAAVTDTLTGVFFGSVVWGDYDNDGDLDILLTGWTGSSRIARVYRNDGSDGPSGGWVFTAVITDTLTGVYGSSVAWGDYDNDGDLDILLTGNGSSSYVAKVYRNDGSDTFTLVGAELTSVTSGSVAWGDYDNDGDLDILLTGYDGFGDVSTVYRNDGSDAFTAAITDTLTRVTNGSVAWGDYDNDGDLDILLTGESLGGSVATIYRNNTLMPNAVPAAPSGLSAQTAGNAVTLIWSAPPPTATTPITGLTYNLYVGTAPGQVDVVPPMAFTATNPLTNGLRLLPALGNAQHGLTATLTGLAEGTYYWSVQAVDHTFAGSPFAVESSFTILPPLSVESALPAPNSHIAPASTNLTVTLTGLVSETSVTTQTVVVHGGFHGHLDGGFDFTETITRSVFAFDPTNDFHPGELVQASVTSGVLAPDGEPSLPYVWQFRAAVTGGSGRFVDTGQSLGSSQSRGVALGDLDDDGDLDAFVANANSQANRVWLNDGTGTFVDSGQSLGSSSSYEVALGDVDRDGDLDALIANNGQANGVWLNDGDGYFTAHPTTPGFGVGQSHSVTLGDLDGDGDLDALIANYSGQAETVWLNDGAGNYSAHPTTPSFGAGDSRDATLGDLDGDGDLDALVANGNDQANTVWLNDGAGSFLPHPTNPSFGTSSSNEVVLGDLDGDGDLDALVANTTDQAQTVWLNDGAGGFVAHPTTPSFGAGVSRSAALGDVDGDGDLDALVANASAQAETTWLNDGAGNFAAHPTRPSFGAGESWAITLGDVDGDGDLDAFVANDSNQANTVWLNPTVVESALPAPNSHNAAASTNLTVTLTGLVSETSVTTQTFVVHGGFQGHLDGSFDFTDSVTRSVFAFDPASDLHPGELVQASVTRGVLDANGGSVFPTVWQFRTAITASGGRFADSRQSLGSSYSRGVALGDLDGDGDLDAFVANTNSQANRVWLNDGTGVYSDSGQNLGSSQSTEVVLGDVDGDGDLDAFVANNSQPNKVWLNNGTGTFADSGQSLGSSPSYGALLGDVDGDGDLDAFVVNYNQANRIWLNDGIGTFADSGQSLGSSQSYDVALGDVDGDGDLDAFVTNWDQANRVWLNDGTGTFGDSGQSLGNGRSYGAALGDLDGDGDLDAFVANGGNQANKVWLNDGTGVYSDSGQNLGSFQSIEVALGDVDGDGDLDAFVANGTNQANKVWLNNGAGTFSDSGQTLGSSTSQGVALGDLDGDGDLDAFVANANQANKVWLDTTWVESVAPLPNGHSAAASTNLTVTFSSLVSETSVTTQTFVVHGGFRGRLDGTLGFTDTITHSVLAFDPAGDLHPGELVEASVTRGVLEPDGEPILPYVWQFRTAVTAGSGRFADSGHGLGSSSHGEALALGDVDGDGDLDAFVGDYSSGPNKVWLNDGTGTFSDSGQSLGSSSSRAMALRDVDGDGDLDAFIANSGTNKVWLNDGAGTFSDSGQSLGSSDSWAVALGDIDGDGDLDAFIGNGGGQANKVWLNDGTGTFSDSGQSLGSAISYAGVLGDLDGDGDLDAFVGNYGQANKVWLNDGTGTFSDSGQSLGNSNSWAAALGDLDGDGDLDVFVENRSGQANKVWLNDGTGTFSDSGQSLGSSDSVSVALGDVDGDSDLDAFDVVYSGTPVNKVWLNDGTGTFSDSGQSLGNSNSLVVALGDVDGDGDLDAFVTNAGGQADKVWLNSVWVESVAPAPNSHSAPASTNLTVTLSSPVSETSVTTQTFVVHGGFHGHLDGSFAFTDSVTRSVFAFDPTNDFHPGEMVQASVTRGVLDTTGWPILPTVWQFRTAVTAGSSRFVDSGQRLGNSWSYHMALGDVDGDGDLDAFIANTHYPNGQPNKVWLNNGAGSFTDSGQSVGSSDDLGVALGDLDGDGDLDAFVASGYSLPNRVWLNTGAGIFYDTGQSLGNSTSYAVALGDLDSDGDLDAFVTNYDMQADRVWLNNGVGIFSSNGQSLGSSYSIDVALGDLDGDGDLDAFTANCNTMANKVWLNNGTGSFSDSGQNLGSSCSYSVDLGDVDGDGDLDAFVANGVTGGQANRVWLNNGSGVFSDSGQSIGNAISTYVALGDLDADGDLDAYVTNAGSPNRVWLNNGSGTFVSSGQSLGSGSRRHVALGDLDGDGDLDAFIADYEGQANEVWFNRNQVEAVAPTANSHSALASTNLTVTVNGLVSQGSVTTHTFVVHGGFQGSLDGSFSFSSTVAYSDIVFDPTSGLHPGELIQASVSDDVLASSTHLLPYVWQFRVAVGGGSGHFIDSGQSLGSSPSRRVALGDLDGDGDLDAFVANMDNQANKVWLNSGTGMFIDSGQNLGNSDSRGVALGDVDGDGDLDAFVANYTQGNRVWLNDGTGTFSDSGQSLGSSTSLAVMLGDVDGDGDLDAFIANVNQANKVWLNNGAGIFSDSGQSLGSATSYAGVLGDLDGDGDLDVFVANANDQPNRVWLNNGTGAFSNSGQSLGSSFSLDVALWDIDDDGDLDAFVANNGQPNKVWLNDGTGTFSDSGQSLGSADSYAVALGDADGDGDLDAFVVNSGQANKIWLNDGTGTFSDSAQSLGNSSSMSVALGDVDGDGDIDAFVANYNQANKVWLNQNAVDLSLAKTVTPEIVAPGQALTYTVTYTNHGPDVAASVLITDVVPATLTNVSVSSSGAAITETGSVSATWQVASLLPGTGGTITITGIVSPSVSGVFSLTNRASITSALVYDQNLDDNTSVVSSTVDAELPAAPTLISPADGVLLADTTPTLEWQASSSPDAAGYLLDLGGVVTDVDDVTQHTSAPLADGVYTWTVAAYDRVHNISAYADIWSFTIDDTAPQVMGTEPVSGETGVDLAAPVVITFSEAISAPTFAYTIAPDPGGWAEMWSGSGTVVTLTHAAFASGAFYTVTITTADDLAGNVLFGAPLTWQFTIYNQPPVANAGLDQVVNTNALVTLDGSGSNDPDGHLPLTYGWTQTGGPAVTFNDALSVTAFTAPNDPAVLTFTLAVTDTWDLASTPDEVVVTVTDQAPVANAGLDQSVDTNALVTLDGSGSSDPDGDLPLTYYWMQTGGPAMTLSSAAIAAPTFTAPSDPTVLTFTLTVTDSLGLPDLTPDEVVISVDNQAPVANAGPDRSVDTNAIVTLNGSGSSDPDGDLPLTFRWTQIGGPAAILNNPAVAAPNFTAPDDPAVLTFTLVVTDSLGLPDPTPDEVVITVNNQSPEADAGDDQTVNTNTLVTLDGSGSSDPDGDLPLSYHWMQTGGPAVTLSDPMAVAPTFAAPDSPTVLTFTLIVTDSLGLPDPTPDEVVVTVEGYRIYLPLVVRQAPSSAEVIGPPGPWR